ncbi:MAG: PAS domain-containing protein [Lentisphaerota bacterium]
MNLHHEIIGGEGYPDRTFFNSAPAGLVALDEAGLILDINPAAAVIIREPYCRPGITSLADLLITESKPALRDHLDRVFSHTEVESCILYLPMRKPQIATLTIQSRRSVTREGLFFCFSGIHDVTDMQRHMAGALRDKEEWQAIFQALPDAFLVVDERHRISRVNKAMEDHLGLPAENIIGQLYYEILYGATCPPLDCPHSKLLEDGLAHEAILPDNRSGRTLQVRCQPLRDAKGHVWGSLHIVRIAKPPPP